MLDPATWINASAKRVHLYGSGTLADEDADHRTGTPTRCSTRPSTTTSTAAPRS